MYVVTSDFAISTVLYLKTKRKKIEHTIHFLFSTTNNAAEYEALLAGIKLATAIGIKKVKIHTDSQLVMGQFGVSFTPKEKNMIRYKEIVEYALQKLDNWEIIQVKRENIVYADTLARLGATHFAKEDG